MGSAQHFDIYTVLIGLYAITALSIYNTRTATIMANDESHAATDCRRHSVGGGGVADVNIEAPPFTKPRSPPTVKDEPPAASVESPQPTWPTPSPADHPANNRLNEPIDWKDVNRNAIRNYNARLANAYLANTRHADITFLIEQDDTEIPAHSVLVGVASEPLESLCYGPNDDVATDTRIQVPDCSRADFVIVLRHLYSFNEPAALNATNVLPIMRCAQLFQLHSLVEQCGAMLASTLSVWNVCRLYSEMRSMQSTFTDQCIQLMVENIIMILENGTAMEMSDEALGDLLASEGGYSRAIPTVVVGALKLWADQRCMEQGLALNGQHRRFVTSAQRFQLLRFDQMSLAEFGKSLELIGLEFLTSSETGEIFRQILARHPVQVDGPYSVAVIGCSCGRPNQPLPNKKRNGKKAQQTETWNPCCYESNLLVFAMPPPKPDRSPR